MHLNVRGLTPNIDQNALEFNDYDILAAKSIVQSRNSK